MAVMPSTGQVQSLAEDEDNRKEAILPSSQLPLPPSGRHAPLPATIAAALRNLHLFRFHSPAPSVVVLLLATVLSLLPGPAVAGDQAKKDVQFWTPTIIQAKVAPRWSVQFDGQIRLVDNVSVLRTAIARPAVVFAPGGRLTYTFGYGWIPTLHPARSDEHRLWQQVALSTRLGGWSIQPRVRFEQRRLPGIDSLSFRLRGQLKAVHAIAQSSRWQLSISNEAFFTLNDARPSPLRGFSTNRAQVGVVRQVTPRLSIEAGYMLQYINRPRPLAGEFDSVAILTTNARF